MEGEVHRQKADRRGEPVILELAQRLTGHELSIAVDHRSQRQFVHNSGDSIGEAHVVRWRRLDAVVDADRLDGLQPLGGIASLDVGHTWGGAHPQHRAQPHPGKSVAQFQLPTSGMEEAAHIGIGHPGLQTGFHDLQVEVVDSGVQAGVRAFE